MTQLEFNVGQWKVNSIRDDLRPYVSYNNPTIFENLIRFLEKRGITSIDQLAVYTDEQLLEMRGIGVKSVEVIRTAIECHRDPLAKARFQLNHFQKLRKEALTQVDALNDRIALLEDRILFLQKTITKGETH